MQALKDEHATQRNTAQRTWQMIWVCVHEVPGAVVEQGEGVGEVPMVMVPGVPPKDVPKTVSRFVPVVGPLAGSRPVIVGRS